MAKKRKRAAAPPKKRTATGEALTILRELRMVKSLIADTLAGLRESVGNLERRVEALEKGASS